MFCMSRYREAADSVDSFADEMRTSVLLTHCNTAACLSGVSAHGTVERSYLPTKRRLDMLGIPQTAFCQWQAPMAIAPAAHA